MLFLLLRYVFVVRLRLPSTLLFLWLVSISGCLVIFSFSVVSLSIVFKLGLLFLLLLAVREVLLNLRLI
jgi:hypothetical protein